MEASHLFFYYDISKKFWSDVESLFFMLLTLSINLPLNMLFAVIRWSGGILDSDWLQGVH